MSKPPIHGDFIQKAKLAALEGNTNQPWHDSDDKKWLKAEDLYVVWFAKTLGNWKALVSTDAVSGIYWEVTYNGAKQETYVDTYIKHGNIAIPDNFFDEAYRKQQ